MYRNINTDLVVKYFYVCVIFKVISRSNRGPIIEKWTFSEYQYQIDYLFSENHMHTSFLWYWIIGIDLVIS